MKKEEGGRRKKEEGGRRKSAGWAELQCALVPALDTLAGGWIDCPVLAGVCVDPSCGCVARCLACDSLAAPRAAHRITY